MRIPSGKIDQVIYFVAVDSSDLKTRKTGLSGFTVYRSRNGGAATAYTTPTIVEISAANCPGLYALTADEDTTIASSSDSEEYVVHITCATMAPVTRTIELYRREVTTGNTLSVSAAGRALSDLDTIKTQTVTCAGGVTVPAATLASTTNITSATGVVLNNGAQTITSLTCTAGIIVTQSSANASGVSITGNGTGHGVLVTSGSGVTGDGLRAVAASTNGNGITGVKTGTGSDLNCTSTPLTLAKTTNITGFNDIAATAVVSAGAITTSGGAVSTVTNVTTVNGLAANAITAASIAASAITSTKFAADAIDSNALATTAVTEIVNGVWNEARSSHTTIGSFGEGVASVQGNVTGSVGSVTAGVTVTTNNDKTGYRLSATGVDDVWDEQISGHLTAGSTGNALNSAGSAGDPWSTPLPGAYGAGTAGKIIGDNINATISSRSTLTGATAAAAVWDEARAGHTTAGTFGQGVASVQGNVTGSVDSVTTGVTVTTNNDKTGYRLSATGVDDVWDEPLAGHATAGTSGKALSDAATGGDPWSTALPGAYGAGTAGNILGNNLNATITSRASQASLDIVDDYVDTEVAAIKAKTDQLTFTVAGQVDSNVQYVNDTQVQGNGQAGTEWGPV